MFEQAAADKKDAQLVEIAAPLELNAALSSAEPAPLELNAALSSAGVLDEGEVDKKIDSPGVCFEAILRAMQ